MAAPNASLQAFRDIQRYLRAFLRSVGFDVLDEHFRPGVLTLLMYADIFAVVGCMVYTTYLYRGDTIEMLKVFYVIASPIQGFIKSSTLLYYKADIYALNQHMLRLHRHCHGRWRRCLLTWTVRIDRVLKFQLVLYSLTGGIFIVFPLIYYALYGEVILNLSLEAPFVDPASGGGYATMMLFEVYTLLLSVAIMFSVDGVFIIMCLTACAYVQMVQLKCDEMSEWLAQMEAAGRAYDVQGAERMLISIVVAGQRAEGFIAKIRLYFEKGCAVQMYSGGTTLAFSILVARMSTLFVAYPMICSYLYMVMAYAFFGTLIEVQSERLCFVIGQMRWYLLSVRHRRMYLLMLQHSQSSACITVFGKIKLNVETGLSILKSIYTAYMMLESTL